MERRRTRKRRKRNEFVVLHVSESELSETESCTSSSNNTTGTNNSMQHDENTDSASSSIEDGEVLAYNELPADVDQQEMQEGVSSSDGLESQESDDLSSQNPGENIELQRNKSQQNLHGNTEPGGYATLALGSGPVNVETEPAPRHGSEEEKSSVSELSEEVESDDEFVDFISSASSSSSSESDSQESNSEDSDEESEHELESDSEDNDGGGGQDGDVPLYNGAPLTLGESMLAIFSLAAAEHLSGHLLSRILELIALHCPLGNLCKKTLYKFKKYFAKIGASVIVFHYFCSTCIYPLQSKDSLCKKCKTGGNASYFLEIPLIHQLQSMFSRRSFYDSLQRRLNPRRKKHTDNIDDIYDGRIYKDQCDSGFLCNPNNISFMWYSDGVQAFVSSASFSIWPLCLVINELPYNERILPQNILLVGLWFGKLKPHPNIFLRPLYKTFKHFSCKGSSMKLHDGTKVLIKGKVICGTCDLPAKAKFLNFKQFNARHGCPQCVTPGDRYPTGPRSTVQVYPYERVVEPRTSEQLKDFASQAVEARKTDKNASVIGVKGPSLLSYLVPDLIRCTGIDIMHGVFLGVCKLLMTLWFDKKYRTQPWSLYDLIDVVDERLQKIKPPSYIQRAPRSLSSIAQWKASEFKLWFTYYSVPLLSDLMENNYIHHHSKLVSAIFLLSQDSIFPAQIDAASALLHSYVADFAGLYSLRFLGINIHQLLHLPDVVRDLGPLWVYSCFFLENFNGAIIKLFHGTQHVALQISSSIAMFMKLPVMVQSLPHNSVISNFCKHVTSRVHPVKIADVIAENIFAIGTYSQKTDSVRHSVAVLKATLNIDNVSGMLQIFLRLKKHRVVYVSSEYGRVSTRKDSSFIVYKYKDNPKCLGQIVRFVKWSMCTPDRCLANCEICPSSFIAIVKQYERQMWLGNQLPDVRLSYISQIKDEMYVTMPVNTVEVE